MTLEQWLELADQESAQTLHKFNFELEQGFADPELTGQHQAFTAFLEPYDEAHFRDADDAVQSFAYQQAGLTPAGSPTPIRSNSRQVFLKATGNNPYILEHFRFDTLAYRKVVRQIADKIRAGPLNDRLEQEVQALVTSLRPPPAPRFGWAPTTVHADRRRRGSFSKLEWPPKLWWFTYEDDLSAERSTLGSSATALERSGYVAGLRARLGLDHPSDALSDIVTASERVPFARGIPETLPALVFRIFYQLYVTIDTANCQNLRQPTMFSRGFRHLFVTHRRQTTGGRTVRLRDLQCAHARGCRCADNGLSEGVVPERVVMAPDSRYEVAAMYFAFERDLRRYQPPSCDDIRSRRTTP